MKRSLQSVVGTTAVGSSEDSTVVTPMTTTSLALPLTDQIPDEHLTKKAKSVPKVCRTYHNLTKQELETMLSDWFLYNLVGHNISNQTPRAVKSKIVCVCTFAVKHAMSVEDKVALMKPMPTGKHQAEWPSWNQEFRSALKSVVKGTMTRLLELEALLPPTKQPQRKKSPSTCVIPLAKRLGHLQKNGVLL